MMFSFENLKKKKKKKLGDIGMLIVDSRCMAETSTTL